MGCAVCAAEGGEGQHAYIVCTVGGDLILFNAAGDVVKTLVGASSSGTFNLCAIRVAAILVLVLVLVRWVRLIPSPAAWMVGRWLVGHLVGRLVIW